MQYCIFRLLLKQIRVLGGISMVFGILSASSLPAFAEIYFIEPYYIGSLCLNLGRFSGSKTLQVEWGKWIGQKTITGDLRNKQMVSFWAYGNNVPEINIYVEGSERANLIKLNCSSQINNNEKSQVHTLNWYPR